MRRRPPMAVVKVERTGAGGFLATNDRGGEVAVGGEDEDGVFTPVELLLAALGGCELVTVEPLTAQRGHRLASLSATVQAEKIEPAATGTPSAAAVAENDKPGTPGWRIRRVGADHDIEGYADRVSVLPGESFQLYVSTTTRGYKVESFRIGWYGGTEARKVWESPHLTGAQQAAATIDGTTRTVTARWKPSITVDTTGWPEGSYLLKLDADSGAQRYVPITVRTADTAGKVVVLNATTTWQAYNLWGGYDLYEGPYG